MHKPFAKLSKKREDPWKKWLFSEFGFSLWKMNSFRGCALGLEHVKVSRATWKWSSIFSFFSSRRASRWETGSKNPLSKIPAIKKFHKRTQEPEQKRQAILRFWHTSERKTTKFFDHSWESGRTRKKIVRTPQSQKNFSALLGHLPVSHGKEIFFDSADF